MADGKGGSLTTILVALIGTAGVIGAALIANRHTPTSAVVPPPDTKPETDPAPQPAPSQPPTFNDYVPQLVAPGAGQTLAGEGRHTVFRWLAVPGASSYKLEVQYCDLSGANCIGYDDQITSSLTGSVDFVGAQPGRWRVTPLDVNNQPGKTSDWRTFVYLQ